MRRGAAETGRPPRPTGCWNRSKTDQFGTDTVLAYHTQQFGRLHPLPGRSQPASDVLHGRFTQAL